MGHVGDGGEEQVHLQGGVHRVGQVHAQRHLKEVLAQQDATGEPAAFDEGGEVVHPAGRPVVALLQDPFEVGGEVRECPTPLRRPVRAGHPVEHLAQGRTGGAARGVIGEQRVEGLAEPTLDEGWVVPELRVIEVIVDPQQPGEHVSGGQQVLAGRRRVTPRGDGTQVGAQEAAQGRLGTDQAGLLDPPVGVRSGIIHQRVQ